LPIPDFDNYTERLNHIDQTNGLISKLYKYVSFSKHLLLIKDKMPDGLQSELIQIIEQHQQKYNYVDFITLSSNLVFSGRYALSLEALKKNKGFKQNNAKIVCCKGLFGRCNR